MKQTLEIDKCRHLNELGFDSNGKGSNLVYKWNVRLRKYAIEAGNKFHLGRVAEMSRKLDSKFKGYNVGDFATEVYVESVNAYQIGDLIQGLGKYNVSVLIFNNMSRILVQYFENEEKKEVVFKEGNELIDNLYYALCKFIK